MSITGIRYLLGSLDPERVIREHGPRVHRHLTRIFGPHADVDDVYQLVFIEVLRSLPSFGGLSRLSTWIRRITWNVAYQEMRQRYRHQRVVTIEHIDEAAHTTHDEANLHHGIAMGQLYLALEELNEKQRATVVMHDVEGMTLKEISHFLGRPVPTVASQLYAGRAFLARKLRGACVAHQADNTTDESYHPKKEQR